MLRIIFQAGFTRGKERPWKISKPSITVLERYKKKAYTRYTVRIRKNKPFFINMEKYVAASNLNELINHLLEDHFKNNLTERGGENVT